MKRYITILALFLSVSFLSAQTKTFLDTISIQNNLILKQYKKIKRVQLDMYSAVTFYAAKITISGKTIHYVRMEFIQGTSYGKPNTYIAVVNEYDWDALLKALGTLQALAQAPQVDLNSINIEYSYETSDGLDIGIFNTKGGNIKWYIQLKNYIDDPSFFTNKSAEFFSALQQTIAIAKSL